MSALKNKLSQKVEFIESDTLSMNDPIVNRSPNTETEQKNNVILLKNNEIDSSNSIVPSFAINLAEAKERLLMLQNFVKEFMIPNVDYGIIPKCNKLTLYKSGAEKLCDIFAFSKQIEILNRIEDWDKGLFHYEIKVILLNKRSGIIEAEGIGSSNSRERKFKSQDSYSLTNTILKMAKKRALIAAILSATRSSDIFTQDIEDLDDIKQNNQQFTNNQNKNPHVARGNIATKNVQIPISKEQQSKIFILAAKNNIPLEYIKNLVKEKYNITESKALTKDQADELLMILRNYTMI